MKKFTLLLICSFMSIVVIAQKTTSLLEDCGTRTPPAAAIIKMESEILQLKKGMVSQVLALPSMTYVPIKAHIVQQTNGTGGVSESVLNNALATLNRLYQPMNLGFFFCGGFNYINSDNYYNFDESTDDLPISANNVNNAINIYFVENLVSGNASLNGYAYFPDGRLRYNMILMRNSAVANGTTLSHEMGHFLNLYHTHETAVGAELVTRGSGANCTSAGDQLCDTPADPCCYFYNTSTCTYDGTGVDAQGMAYSPALNNLMSYYHACRNQFTTGQYNRMSDGYNYRSFLMTQSGQYNYSCGSTSMPMPVLSATFQSVLGVQLSWTDPSNSETGFLIERATSINGPYQYLGGVAANTTSFLDYSIANNTTYYYRIKPSNSISYSNTSSVVTTNLLNYCIPSSSCSDSDGIDSFTLNNQQISTGTGCSGSGGFSAFANPIASLSAGQTYTFSMNLLSTTYNEGIAVFLDADRDGTFSASEKIYASATTVNTGLSGSLTIPTNAQTGMLRMRIRAIYNTPASSIDACSNFSYGETEDYIVNISCPLSASMNISTNATNLPLCSPTNITLTAVGCNTGTFSWNDGNINKIRTVSVSQQTTFTATCVVGQCPYSSSYTIPYASPGTQNTKLIWEKSFGGTAGESFDDIVKTADGGYLAIDISYSDISGNKTQPHRGLGDGLIVKFDVNGNIVWEKTYGGSGHDDLLRIKALSDGNFMVLARSASGIEYEKTSPNKGNIDFWLFKIDPNGNVIWDRTYGANSIDYGNDFMATPDGGVILVGTVFMDATMIAPNGDRSQAGKGDHDAWVIKIDANGNKVWDKVFGGSGTESANKIVKAADNSGYYIFGLASTTNIAGSDLSAPARNGYDAWLFKFDENGNKIFDKVYSGGNSFSGASSTEDIYEMGVLPDGNYLLAAHSNNNSGNEKSENSMGDDDLWLIKISPNGTIIKDKTIGGDGQDKAGSFYVRSDGSILFCGSSGSNQNVDKKDALKGNIDGWILNLDANLNIIWSENVGGAIITPTIIAEGLSRMIYEGNDIFTFVGYSTESKGDRTESWGQYDGWVVKMKIPLTTKPTISSPNTLACVGEPITLNANGCISDILWSNGSTSTSIVVKPSSNDNTYTVTCRTAANNCISMQSDVYRPIVADANQNLTGTATSGTVQAKNTIVSRQTIPSGSNVNYRAGKSITLENNQSFSAQNGSVFKAEIAACAIENGLLARYDFNNNVQDLSGNNRNGLVNTAMFTKDRFGNPNAALSFNGVNQYVTLGNWFNYQEFTVSFWLNAGATQTNAYAELIDNNHTGSRSWFAQQNGTINNQYYFGADGSPRGDVYFNLTSTWNHVTLIKGAGVIKMYLNGKLVGTSPHGGNITYDGTQNLILGAWYASGTFQRFWNGKMDDLKLYNRALSDSEINTIFNAEAPNPSLSAGLFANYKFDGNANDISGKGNNGTINGGATFTTDRFGTANKALNFDGVDDHVSVPNNNTLSGFNEITMSAWVNHNQTTGTLGAIIAKWHQSVQDNYLMVVDGGTYKFGASTNNERIVPFYSPSSTPINTWTHVTFTHDSSGDRLYIDGYLAASNTVSGSIIYSSQNLLIGADSNLGTLWRFFKGKIDDVRLYNRSLSRLEVQQLYDLEKP